MAISDVIQKYIELRDQKSQLEKEHKEEVKELKGHMARLEAALLEQLDAQGVQSFKTDQGTAFTTTGDRAVVRDWEATLDFIRDEGAYDLLERKVSRVAVRAYIEETGDAPPGVDFTTHRGVNIRRPNK